LDLTFLITSALTHFLVPAQKRRKYKKIQKTINKKNINNKLKKYSGEKRMPERPENGQKVVEEVQYIYI